MSQALSKHPREIFPEEIWETIFYDSDLDPEDIYRVRQVSKYFQDLLEKRKIRDIFFPLAIQIPHFRDILKSNDCLPLLRSICKKWRNVVDETYSEVLKASEYRHEWHRFYVPPVRPVVLMFLKDVRRFLESFQAQNPTVTPAKQFFTRSIFVSYEWFNPREDLRQVHEFTGLLYRLFECIGDQVEHLIYRGPHVGWFRPLPRYYSYFVLRKLVSFCPNLKGLHPIIHVQICYERLEPEEECEVMLRRNPFPALSKLTTFTAEPFTCNCDMCGGFYADPLEEKERHIAVSIAKHILKRNPHIKHFDASDEVMLLLRTHRHRQLRNLKVLESVKMEYDGNADFFNPKLHRNSWFFLDCPSLTRITIYEGEICRGLTRPRPQNVFGCLETLASTLKHVTLRIRWNVDETPREKKTLKLNLPNVTFFSCNFYPGFTSLDFLRPGVKALETLECFIDGWLNNIPLFDKVLDLSTEIHFIGCMSKMKESNIWEKLPKLKQVKIRSKENLLYERKFYHTFLRVNKGVIDVTNSTRPKHAE